VTGPKILAKITHKNITVHGRKKPTNALLKGGLARKFSRLDRMNEAPGPVFSGQNADTASDESLGADAP
jgi:hypothetical protein